MAQKTQVILVDDVDGSEANQTVTFALDGVTYEIDLNDEHAAALRESLEEWSERLAVPVAVVVLAVVVPAALPTLRRFVSGLASRAWRFLSAVASPLRCARPTMRPTPTTEGNAGAGSRESSLCSELISS